jgi:hypothetical protein
VEKVLGIQLNGSAVVSVLGLSEVETIQTRGATKMKVSRIKAA